jgi:chromosome segregation ATPase
MEIALPLLAIASLIVAAVFAVNAKNLSERLADTKPKLLALENELKELQRTAQQRSQKEKNRGNEVDELREKHKDLRRQLNEAQEQAKKLKDSEDMRREAENEAREQASQSRAEAQEATHQMRVLRAELDLLKSRRPLRAPATPEAPKNAAAVAPSPTSVIPVLQPDAAYAELESRVRELQARTSELDAKAKGADRKAHEAVREQERMKAKISTADKLYVVQRGELELWKDRYRTLEQRLNKTLREVDALHRGVLALERRLPQAKVEEARAEAHALSERAAAERAALEKAAAEETARAAALHSAATDGAPPSTVSATMSAAISDRPPSSEWEWRAASEPSLPEAPPDASVEERGGAASGPSTEVNPPEAAASGIPPSPSEAVPEV